MNDVLTATVAPQRTRALKLANHVRCVRAELKRQVAEKQLDAADIILACPPEAASMPIEALLLSQRGWGRCRCRAFLAQLPMGENKPIGSLTERQRNVVATLLPRRPQPRTADPGSRWEPALDEAPPTQARRRVSA